MKTTPMPMVKTKTFPDYLAKQRTNKMFGQMAKPAKLTMKSLKDFASMGKGLPKKKGISK